MKQFGKIVVALYVLIASMQVYGQLYPVQLTPQNISPNPVYLSNYASTNVISDRLKLQILLNDFTTSNKEVRLKVYIQGEGINAQSKDFVVGARSLFLEGGLPVQLGSIDLAPYFEFQNLQGINPNIYANALPEGSYNFCYEVYDVITGTRLSQKTCSSFLVFKNEPPLLSLPINQGVVEQRDPYNIFFQWMPRSTNVSNIQYEFSLVQIFDNYIDPQAAFLGSQPIFQTTVSQSNLVYDTKYPPLLSGYKYAWRVRAFATQGAEEIGVFENQGNSEIWSFTYTAPCTAPTNSSEETIKKTNAKIVWAGAIEHIDYTISYREKDAGSNWYILNTPREYINVNSLRPGTTYEYKVAGNCEFGGFEYSSIKEFTTLQDGTNDTDYVCNVPTGEIDLSNQELLDKLLLNDLFFAGDFPITVLELTSDTPPFTGKGYIGIPWLDVARVGVEFENIQINTDFKLVQGVVQTTYDADWGNIGFVDEYTDWLDEDNDINEVTVPFVIDTIEVDPDTGTITITATNGVEVEYPSGDDYTIVDANGNVHHVDEEGNVSEGGEIAEGGAIDTDTIDGFGTNGDLEQLSAESVKVIFESSGIYAYDKIPTSERSALQHKYKTITDLNGEPYDIIHKVVVNGKSDVLKARIVTDDSTILSRVEFKTDQGVAIKHTLEGSTATLDLKGLFSYESQDIYAAIIPEEGSTETQKIAGIFKLWHLSEDTINVTIVPINGASVPSNIQEQLNAIYGPSAINFEVKEESTITIDSSVWGNDSIGVGDSGWFAHYTDDQKAIKNVYDSQRGIEEDRYYLFVTDEQPSRPVAGFMPLKSQYGFIFNNSQSGAEESKANTSAVMAHELGHGVFGLKHPFSELNTTQSSTSWLMDYSDGSGLTHMDWKKMHNPDFELYLFQDDEEGAYTDSEFADKIFQIIRCEYLNSNTDLVTFDIGTFGKTGDFLFKWKGNDIGVFIENGRFEGNPLSNPVELTSNVLKRNLPSRFSLPYKNIEIYTPKYNSGADPKTLNELRKYLFPDDKLELNREAEEILASIISKDEFTKEDFEKIKSIANCGVQYWNANQKFSVISKIVKNVNLLEYYEDLLLDLFETTPLVDNESTYYSEFFKLLLGDTELFDELLSDIDDTNFSSLWIGNEDNYTRFLKILGETISKIGNDNEKWDLVNYFAKKYNNNLKEKEQVVLKTIFSSLEDYQPFVNEIPDITKLFAEMLVEECENLDNYRIIFEIARERYNNEEVFIYFTQSRIINNETRPGVNGTIETLNRSWALPYNLRIRNGNAVGSYLAYYEYKWAKVIAETYGEPGKKEYSRTGIIEKELNQANSKLFFEKFLTELRRYSIDFQIGRDLFWEYVNIECDKLDVIADHINLKENTASMKKVDKEKRSKLLVKIFNCDWLNILDGTVVKSTSEAITKLITSFEPEDQSILKTIENEIGLNTIYDKLYFERLSQFLAWMGAQITSSNYQLPISLDENNSIIDDDGNFRNPEDLLQLESDLFRFENFDVNKITAKGIITPQLGELPYNQMVLVYVSGSFTFLGQRFKKGDVLVIPLVQAFAMSNSNRNEVIIKGFNLGMDVLSVAVGVGGIKLLFRGGKIIQKSFIAADVFSTSINAVTTALDEDAISPETRFRINMFSLFASVPQNFTVVSSRFRNYISDLDNRLIAADITPASRRVLKTHLNDIAKKLGVSNQFNKIPEGQKSSVDITWGSNIDQNEVWFDLVDGSVKPVNPRTFSDLTNDNNKLYDLIDENGNYLKFNAEDGSILVAKLDESTGNATYLGLGQVEPSSYDSFIDDPNRLQDFLEARLEELSVLTGIIKKPINIGGINYNLNSNKVNTVLGRYKPDIKNLFSELGSYKNIGLGETNGGVNLLNRPDAIANNDNWWYTHNKPWLDRAVERGDDIYLATIPNAKSDLINDVGNLTGAYPKELRRIVELDYKPKNVSDAKWNQIKSWMSQDDFVLDIEALGPIVPTGANNSYIGARVINDNANQGRPVSGTLLKTKVDEYLNANDSNLRRELGKEIAGALVSDMPGYNVKPSKLSGSDNGFDKVVVKENSTGVQSIRIVKSKSMNDGAVNLPVIQGKGTQMSDQWVLATIQQMKNSDNSDELIELGNLLDDNLDKIEKFVSTVDKNSGEIVVIKLGAF